MLRKRNVDAHPANRPPADVRHFNDQSFPLENMVKIPQLLLLILIIKQGLTLTPNHIVATHTRMVVQGQLVVPAVCFSDL